jgi:heme exporter protein A
VIATHIDLGLPTARSLDITPFTRRSRPEAADAADPFLSEGAL